MRFNLYTTALMFGLTLTGCTPEPTVVEEPCSVEQTAGGALMTCPNGESFLFRDAPQGRNAQSFAYLVQTAEIEPGETCPQGGLLVRVGRDDDNDGLLDDDEEVSREAVCRGEDGADGSQVLVERVPISPGEGCPGGGSRLRVGTDIDRDGALAESEVELTSDLCTPSTNACTPDHIVFDDGQCVPLYSMDLEAVVIQSTLSASSNLPNVAVGDAVQGSLAYPWELDDFRFSLGVDRSVLIYTYGAGQVESSWTLAGETFAGASSGSFDVGDYDTENAGVALTASTVLGDDGAPSGISSVIFEATRSGLVLESYRPPSPELLELLTPFSLRLGDQAGGTLELEVRSVTRRSDLP